MSSTASNRPRRPRSTDARALRSRDALRAALLELIEVRPFEQISIRDITRQAGVSYPVFFRRYATKEELLEDIATEEVHQLLSLTSPIFYAVGQTASLRALCDYVHERRALWTSLLTVGAAAAMREEFKRIAREMAGTHERTNPWLPTELAAAFVVTGLFEILAWWLRQPPGYPIANVVQIIDVLIIRSTAQPVDVQLL